MTTNARSFLSIWLYRRPKAPAMTSRTSSGEVRMKQSVLTAQSMQRPQRILAPMPSHSRCPSPYQVQPRMLPMRCNNHWLFQKPAAAERVQKPAVRGKQDRVQPKRRTPSAREPPARSQNKPSTKCRSSSHGASEMQDARTLLTRPGLRSPPSRHTENPHREDYRSRRRRHRSARQWLLPCQASQGISLHTCASSSSRRGFRC
ncbi:hypothetical protein HDK64DRAFT_264910 [Phyllosticta capitalensis]